MDENYLANEALENIENILFDDMEENQYKLYVVSYEQNLNLEKPLSLEKTKKITLRRSKNDVK